jgi:hypothetical protein
MKNTRRQLSVRESERLCELTTRAMVNGVASLNESEQAEREALALRLYIKKPLRKTRSRR